MFKSTSDHHGSMMVPKPLRASAGDEVYQDYEKTDESSATRSITRTLTRAPDYEDLPTTQEADTGVPESVWKAMAVPSPPLQTRPTPVPLDNGW